MKQDMLEWQWHQLDHIQIICTTLQTGNHASTSSLSFLQAGLHNQHCQSTEGQLLDHVNENTEAQQVIDARKGI